MSAPGDQGSASRIRGRCPGTARDSAAGACRVNGQDLPKADPQAGPRQTGPDLAMASRCQWPGRPDERRPRLQNSRVRCISAPLRHARRECGGRGQLRREDGSTARSPSRGPRHITGHRRVNPGLFNLQQSFPVSGEPNYIAGEPCQVTRSSKNDLMRLVQFSHLGECWSPPLMSDWSSSLSNSFCCRVRFTGVSTAILQYRSP